MERGRRRRRIDRLWEREQNPSWYYEKAPEPAETPEPEPTPVVVSQQEDIFPDVHAAIGGEDDDELDDEVLDLTAARVSGPRLDPAARREANADPHRSVVDFRPVEPQRGRHRPGRLVIQQGVIF